MRDIELPPNVNVKQVQDKDDGKFVSLTVTVNKLTLAERTKYGEGMREVIAENKARAVALAAAGFAEEGYLQSPDINVESLDLKRRTEVVDKFQITDTQWEFKIEVRDGPILS